MGLAASQSRLLSLTSRQHTVEYDAQRIQNNKMRLANDSDRVYQTYLNALNDTALKTKQINSEGDTYWISGNINNLMRYGTSDDTSGSVFYVQDLQSGKLYVPELIGNNYDIATDARNFAEQFGITYTVVDNNASLRTNYENALANGWNNLMTEEQYQAYINYQYTASNNDTYATEIMNYIPSLDSNGLYTTADTQTVDKYKASVNQLIQSGYLSSYTEAERNLIHQSLNIMNSITEPGDYPSDWDDDSMPGQTTQYRYSNQLVVASKDNTEYVSSGYFSDTDTYLMMLNGGYYQSTATETESIHQAGYDFGSSERTWSGTAYNIYDSTTQSYLNAYNQANSTTYTTMGEALTAIFSSRASSSSTQTTALDYINNTYNTALTAQDITNYVLFKQYELDYQSYVEDIEYIPSDKVKAAYYEQIYNAIDAAGGYIKADESRASNDTWVQNMIKNTQVILTTWDDENSMLSNTSASLNTNLKEVTDDAKIAKVEQVYEDEMALINNKDTNYDNVLSKLETERTSLNTEIESLENIIKNNIETTFKLYS